MRWKNRPDKDNVRVIRDIRNANRDYWIPRERAEQLFQEGKLVQVEAYANKWVYSTKTPDEYYV
jgi:hypothetical protein